MNTLCTLPSGFTQAFCAFFIWLDLDTLSLRLRLNPMGRWVQISKAEMSVLSLAAQWLAQTPSTASQLSHPSQTRSWHRYLCSNCPCLTSTSFFAHGCVCSHHTAVKVLTLSWWEYQGWSLAEVPAADHKAACFLPQGFPCWAGPGSQPSPSERMFEPCSGKAEALC